MAENQSPHFPDVENLRHRDKFLANWRDALKEYPPERDDNFDPNSVRASVLKAETLPNTGEIIKLAHAMTYTPGGLLTRITRIKR